MPTLRLIPALLVFLALGGCQDVFGPIDQGHVPFYVYTSHTARPVNDRFPDYGKVEEARVFDNDLGWHITLAEALITTVAVDLVDCGGASRPMNLEWGPCADNVIDIADHDDPFAVATLNLKTGEFCELHFAYGPYPTEQAPVDYAHDSPPATIAGRTIYLRGLATKAGSENVNFEFRASGERVVELSLVGLEAADQPLKVESRENVPTQVNVNKTYDAFFAGIDFAAYDQAAVEAGLLDVLAEQTRISYGMLARPY